jgi:hypothetical protein
LLTLPLQYHANYAAPVSLVEANLRDHYEAIHS